MYFVAEALAHECTDAVRICGRAGEKWLERRTELAASREQSRRDERSELSGDAEDEPRWQGMQPVAPDRRMTGGRRHEVVAEAHRACKIDTRRCTEKKGIGGLVDGVEARERRGLDEPTDTGLRLHDGDAQRGIENQQLAGACEAGDARADDHDMGRGPQCGALWSHTVSLLRPSRVQRAQSSRHRRH